MRYAVTQHSVPGTRTVNQDRAALAERTNAVLMVVADGLGGYAGGEMAAQIMVDTMVDSFHKVRTPVIQDPAAFLVLSMSLAHSRINRRSKQEGITVSSPRTTCAACLIQSGYAYWAHVGDSRLYHFRDGRFLTRTIDHTTTDPMYQEGYLDERESMREAGHLVRCVGGPKRPLVSLGAETRLEKGDVILLCTDGIWRAFTDKEMEKAVEGGRLEESVERLMAKSARTFRRDCDNMTAVALVWRETATTKPPLLSMAIPELDQDALWREARQRSAERKERRRGEGAGTQRRKSSNEIEATIAEIESFVEDLESML